MILQRLVLLSRVWGADAPVEESNLDTYIQFCAQTLTTGGKPRNHRDGAGNWLLYQITHGRKRCFKNYTGN